MVRCDLNGRKQAVTVPLLIALAVSVVVASAIASPDPNSQLDRSRGLTTRVGVLPEEFGSGQPAEVGLWAVLVGVSRYQFGDQNMDGYRISNLKNAADDARALYEFLKSPEGGGFRDASDGGNMLLLTDEQATKANVESALAKLKQTRPNDYFVVYIAAHGAIIPQRDTRTNTTNEVPYFLVYDSDLRDPAGTAVRMDLFSRIVAETPAQKGLVLSDTCHAAGVQLAGRGDASSTSIRANDRFLDEMNRIPTGVGFISASGQLEQSFELDDLQQGVFTHCLLEALSLAADTNNDGIVTFIEAVTYLREEVPRLTQNKQHPHYNTTAIAANRLPIAVVNYAATEGSSPGSRFGALRIRTPDLDGVEVAIDGQQVATLDSSTQRTVAVEAGVRRLSFRKGEMRRDIQAVVEPGRSKIVEVNLSFSESEDDSLVDAAEGQVNVFLREEKEPSREAKELFTRGVESYNKQKFEDAVQLFNKAIRANANAYADAFVYLGRAEQSLGRKEAAIRSFKAALALRPTDFETETLLAEAKFNAGYNVEEVITQLRGIVRRHPNFDFARVVYGDVLLLRRDYIGAERELRRAILVNPKSPPAHLILADALTYQESPDKQRRAVQSAERALELFEEVSRKQVSASRGLKRLSISHIIFGGGRYVNDSAMAEVHHVLAKALTRVVDRDTTLANPDGYVDRARGHIDQAMKFAKRQNDNRRLVLLLDTSAQAYLLKGDVAAAIQEAQRALKTSESIPDLKDYSEVHYTLYSAYTSGQQFAKAVEHLQRYLTVAGSQLSPDERNVYQEELNRLKRLRDANRQRD